MTTVDWTGVRDKRVVLTGATSGIGLAAATGLAALGAELAIIARSPQRAAEATERIAAADPRGRRPDIFLADLASQADLRRVADEIRRGYDRLEVLINNAGAIYAKRQFSADGVELTWAVNHLAAFSLTTSLLDLIEASAPARIITTSSAAHQRARIPFEDLGAERGYSSMGFKRYGETKLANILFTVELARRLQGSRVTANSFHPGFVGTGFNLNNPGLMRAAMSVAHRFARTPARGAETLIWLADSPEVSDVSGGYFVDKRRVRPSRAAQDGDAAQRLWQVSQSMLVAGAQPVV